MKKLPLLIVAVMLFASTPAFAAKSEGGAGSGTGQQSPSSQAGGSEQDSSADQPPAQTGQQSPSVPSSTGSQVQNQNQIQTQNQGEETQLQVAHQEVEQLMEMSGLTGEVGAQVQELAQEQVRAQNQIQQQLSKLELRKGWMKKLFGPDYRAIKNLKQLMEENRLRIQQFEQVKTQVASWGTQTQIQEAVQALIDQNTALEEQIQAEEQASSLLGWLFKLFVR